MVLVVGMGSFCVAGVRYMRLYYLQLFVYVDVFGNFDWCWVEF